VSRYQKGKTNLDFTEARDSEWQWHQLGRMKVCTALQRDSHASTLPLKFFTGQMPFLPPNQQRQSTEGIIQKLTQVSLIYCTEPKTKKVEKKLISKKQICSEILVNSPGKQVNIKTVKSIDHHMQSYTLHSSDKDVSQNI